MFIWGEHGVTFKLNQLDLKGCLFVWLTIPPHPLSIKHHVCTVTFKYQWPSTSRLEINNVLISIGSKFCSVAPWTRRNNPPVSLSSHPFLPRPNVACIVTLLACAKQRLIKNDRKGFKSFLYFLLKVQF